MDDIMTKKNNKEWIFGCSFLMAFVTHCSMFFGGAMGINEDNFTIYRQGYTNAALGRWVCDVLYKMGIPGPYRAQSWIGIFVILALAVTCLAVLSLIPVKNKINALLIIAVLVTFPTLSYSYGYLYDAVMYTFSLMFATISVDITNKYKHGWIGGGVCLMLSLGLYQAWIAVAVALIIVYIIIQVKENNFDKKQIIKLVTKNAIMGISGIIFYFISVKLYNSFYHITLSSYKGLDSMGNIAFTELPQLIVNCYRSFKHFVEGEFYHMPKQITILNYIILLILCLFSAKIVIDGVKLKEYFRVGVFSIFVMALPIGTCLMEIVANTDTLSIYGICMIYILLIKYSDDWVIKAEKVPIKMKKIFTMSTRLICVIMIFFFFYITQIYYFKVHVFYQRTYAIANRMVMRIEELEEYPAIRKVVIGGNPGKRQDYGTAEVMFDDVITSDRGLWGQYVGMGVGTSDYALTKFTKFMNGFLGTNYESVKSDEMLELMRTDEYMRMPVWPHKDSVQVINDIIIIKMNEYRWIDINGEKQRFEFLLKSDTENNVYYVWQLFKDEIEISNYIGEKNTYEAILQETGTYFARVYIKDNETGEILDTVVSENIVIN